MTPLVRTLIVTNLLLTLSILILGAWLYSIWPGQTSNAMPIDTADRVMQSETPAQAEYTRAESGASNRTPDVRQIESIVRETVRSELRRHDERARLESASNPAMPGSSTANVSASDDPRRIEEIRIQHRIVAEELDHFIERGRISSTEMSALQVEIGKLPPEGRIAAMRRLVAALNSGELKGQL